MPLVELSVSGQGLPQSMYSVVLLLYLQRREWGGGGGGGEWGEGGGGSGGRGVVGVGEIREQPTVLSHTTYLGVLPVDVVNDEQLKSNKKTYKIK